MNDKCNYEAMDFLERHTFVCRDLWQAALHNLASSSWLAWG